MNEQRSRSGSSAGRVVTAAAIIAVVASVVDVGIATAAVALGVPATVQLGAPGVVVVSVVGSVVAALGWNLVRSRATHAASALRRIVPIALLASFIPDLLLGFATAASTGWTPIATLATMHVTTAIVAVVTCSRAMPVDQTEAIRVVA